MFSPLQAINNRYNKFVHGINPRFFVSEFNLLVPKRKLRIFVKHFEMYLTRHFQNVLYYWRNIYWMITASKPRLILIKIWSILVIFKSDQYKTFAID